MNIKVVESPKLSKQYDKRYEIVDADTGEILDNAQGYGYKDIRSAYAAWGYKHRDKKKNIEKKKRYAAARAWLKQHEGIQGIFDRCAFEIASWGPADKVNTQLVKNILKDHRLDIKDECFKPFDLHNILMKG